MNFVYLFKALLKRKWIIILVTGCALLVAFYLTKDLKKQYKSTAELSTGFTISDQVRLQDDKLNLTESDVKFNNVIETLQSPTVVSLVSYSLILHDLNNVIPFKRPVTNQNSQFNPKTVDISEAKIVFQNKLDSLQILTSYKPEEKKLIEFLKVYGYDYENLLRYNISVGRVPGTDYISMVASTENPELSAFIVNTLCKQFLIFYKSQRTERSGESVDAFKNLMEQKQKILTVKTDSLKRFKSAHGILNIESEGKSNYEMIQTYQTQLSAERNNYNGIYIELTEVKKRLAQLGTSPGPTVSTVTNADVYNLKSQISSLKSELERKGGTDVALKAKISDLQNQLIDKQDKLSSNDGSVPNTTASQRDILLDRQSDLEIKLQTSARNIEDDEKGIKALQRNYSLDAATEANITSQQKEVDLANAEYTSAKEKYSQATDLGRASFNENLRQVLFGQPAISPEASKRLIIVALSGVTSCILSILIIILLEYLDFTLKTPSIFSSLVDLNLIAIINKGRFKKASIENIFFSANLSDKENKAYKELIRKCRYEIEHLNQKVFLFTSNKSQEGKTTLIYSLALALANAQKKILIIDTNFSNNSLTQMFQAKNLLEAFVRKGLEITKENIDPIISKTENPYIDIIGCEGGSYSPSEIFQKDTFSCTLEILSHTYDYIFLEGASLNQYSDSKELTEYVQGVISVFSARSSIKQTDKDSITFLHSLNGKFAGAVLNMVEYDQIDL